jgi:hypothetical protein
MYTHILFIFHQYFLSNFYFHYNPLMTLIKNNIEFNIILKQTKKLCAL